ncbi:MAG TPA: DNA polymerase III subunit gamma/tau [Candidatus Saccharimonadales bacterium]
MGKKRADRALYRHYRSRSLDEIIGQEPITTTLANVIKSGRINHAYLFVGPRGVGKTSVARILAHAINDLPYDGTTNHLDIIEIDAASNRGIDEIRELRDKVHLVPTSAKYKVYIIDEVHMLTTPAFNALLKTLEEPPGHAIFILATTEGHKIPATITSRTQRFNFQPITATAAVEQLKKVATKEGISADDSSLKLIAEYGQGSMRDSLSLLDQLSSQGQVKLEAVVNLIGLAPERLVTGILTALNHHQSVELLELLDKAKAAGVSQPILARQLIDGLRRQLSQLEAPQLDLFEELLNVPNAVDPELKLEVILLKYCLDGNTDQLQVKTKTSTDIETAAGVPVELDSAAWQRVMNAIKTSHNSLHAVLRQAKPAVQDGVVVLSFGFDFHRRRLEEERNKAIVSQAIAEVLNRQITLKTAVDDALKPSNNQADLSQVISVMGGGDVMDYRDE